MIAAKYDFLVFEDGARFEGPEEKTEAATSLYKRVKSKVEDLKKRVFDWALFDKDKMLTLLAEYSAQTERLRQIMSLILLTLTAMGSRELRDFAESKKARNMRLQNLVEIRESSTDSNLKLANYEGDWGQVKRVVVEYRAYDNTMKIAPHGTFEESMAPIRNLAWLLCSSSHLDAQDAVPDISDQSSIFTLPCLGYLDDPDEGRTAFLYQLPRAGICSPLQTSSLFMAALMIPAERLDIFPQPSRRWEVGSSSHTP
ncbi:uncharacterized protein BJX67DRAFT_377369 [Aspergillus lucknowensis]|uniref:Prion-inhibition and propagation HeLo domain-containing protein n=1 Tax=Aspergillus lucknowensis TaxID=176173 RepID=A0ABR4M4T5_9EURO